MTQMNEITRGERAHGREFHLEPIAIQELRSKLGLSQSKFAAQLHVEVGTLRNREQDRREPAGLAKGSWLQSIGTLRTSFNRMLKNPKFRAN